MRDFQGLESKLQKKHLQEKELLTLKLKQQPSSPHQQTELIKQLSTQLRDSTAVIKSQQTQINQLKSTRVSPPKRHNLVIETDDDVCELKA